MNSAKRREAQLIEQGYKFAGNIRPTYIAGEFDVQIAQIELSSGLSSLEYIGDTCSASDGDPTQRELIFQDGWCATYGLAKATGSTSETGSDFVDNPTPQVFHL